MYKRNSLTEDAAGGDYLRLQDGPATWRQPVDLSMVPEGRTIAIVPGRGGSYGGAYEEDAIRELLSTPPAFCCEQCCWLDAMEASGLRERTGD